MAEFARPDTILTIVFLGMVTAALRLGGFFLMRYVPITPRVRRMLEALPGSVIVATVLPVVMQGGVVVAASVLAGMLVMYLTRSDLVAAISGVGVAALLRAIGVVG